MDAPPTGPRAFACRPAAVSCQGRPVSVPGAGGRFWTQGSIAQLASTVLRLENSRWQAADDELEAAPQRQPLPQTLDHLPGQRGNHCGLIMGSDADAILEATMATWTR